MIGVVFWAVVIGVCVLAVLVPEAPRRENPVEGSPHPTKNLVWFEGKYRERDECYHGIPIQCFLDEWEQREREKPKFKGVIADPDCRDSQSAYMQDR
ncbi:hypothetical protein CB599_11720 [Salmonella enterica subsp. enterica serovar Adjame]|nr:hypothetical protein [Salmonella enterica subsp. enterica serovar Adjame]